MALRVTIKNSLPLTTPITPGQFADATSKQADSLYRIKERVHPLYQQVANTRAESAGVLQVSDDEINVPLSDIRKLAELFSRSESDLRKNWPQHDIEEYPKHRSSADNALKEPKPNISLNELAKAIYATPIDKDILKKNIENYFLEQDQDKKAEILSGDYRVYDLYFQALKAMEVKIPDGQIRHDSLGQVGKNVELLSNYLTLNQIYDAQ